jgi:hypothetical protein
VPVIEFCRRRAPADIHGRLGDERCQRSTTAIEFIKENASSSAALIGRARRAGRIVDVPGIVVKAADRTQLVSLRRARTL